MTEPTHDKPSDCGWKYYAKTFGVPAPKVTVPVTISSRTDFSGDNVKADGNPPAQVFDPNRLELLAKFLVGLADSVQLSVGDHTAWSKMQMLREAAEGLFFLYNQALFAAPAPASPFAQQVQQITTELADMLIAKNKAYGNSALDPVRVFSQADTAEQIRVRIDDKLSRLQRGNAHNEDTILDLMGYLVLLRIAEAAKEAKP